MPDTKRPNAAMKGGRASAPKGTFKRILKSVFHFYPRMLIVALVLIVCNAVISSIPSIFMQKIFTIVVCVILVLALGIPTMALTVLSL